MSDGNPTARRNRVFRSFWMAGFEAADHRNRFGHRVDMLAGIQHDRKAAEDYANLVPLGIRCARDGLRWPAVDRGGAYDLSSWLPIVKAARQAGVQVIWTLCHYGWPDDLDVFSAAFVDRLAKLAGTACRVLRETSDEVPMFTPVNEISFLCWAACRDFMYPFAVGRDQELKRQLVRATIAVCEAVWDVDRRARFLYPEPVVRVFPPRSRPDLADEAESYNRAQYEAWDMIAGRLEPELGGAEKYLDIVGMNYYHANQWEHTQDRLRWEDEPRDPRWVPFHRMVLEASRRYARPLCISETGHFGAGRGRWILEIAREVAEACRQGACVEAVCLYPILDRYDWENPEHWHNSGLWDFRNEAGDLRRVLNADYAAALQQSQQIVAAAGLS